MVTFPAFYGRIVTIFETLVATKVLRSTVFIVFALAVGVTGWLLYSHFSGLVVSTDIDSKGPGDALMSPQTAAIISLATSVIGMLSGLAGLAIKLVDLRGKTRED